MVTPIAVTALVQQCHHSDVHHGDTVGTAVASITVTVAQQCHHGDIHHGDTVAQRCHHGDVHHGDSGTAVPSW